MHLEAVYALTTGLQAMAVGLLILSGNVPSDGMCVDCGISMGDGALAA